MVQTTGRRERVYGEIASDKTAWAAYSGCGAPQPAQRLTWVRHPERTVYLALCPSCEEAQSSAPPGDAALWQGLTAHTDPTLSSWDAPTIEPADVVDEAAWLHGGRHEDGQGARTMGAQAS
jgi:hypothetical protein